MRQGIVILVRVIKPYQLGTYGIGGGLTVPSCQSSTLYFLFFLVMSIRGLYKKQKRDI